MVYFILIFLSIVSIVVFDVYKFPKYKRIYKFILWVVAVLTMGLRYRVGIDTLNYMEYFSDYPTMRYLTYDYIIDHNFSPLFVILNSLSKSIYDSFYTFQIIHAIIINACIFKFIFKNTNYPFIGLLLFFAMYYLYFNTEILRESFAISVFLLNYSNLKQKKWVSYYLLSIVSILFHSSALILLLFPLVRFIRLNWTYLIMLVVFVVLIIEIHPFLVFLENFEKISNKVNVYIDYEKLNLTWVAYNLIQITLFPLFLLFVYKKILRQNSEYEYLICIHALLGIGILFFQLIFTRFSNYTLPFLAIFFADFIGSLIRDFSDKKYLYKMMMTLIIVVYASAYFISAGYYADGARRYHFWLPYHSVFDEKTEDKRETIWINQFN
ncbi:MAG: EpsG family protein [Paludibacter sp.]|nr:EpsG family protein [Paludibacter sp.]